MVDRKRCAAGLVVREGSERDHSFGGSADCGARGCNTATGVSDGVGGRVARGVGRDGRKRRCQLGAADGPGDRIGRLHAADPNAQVQVRAEIDPRNLQRVCLAQPASVTVNAFPNIVIHAQVELINSVISNRTLFMAGNEGRSPDVARIILSLENGGTNLSVGLPVTVLFDPCPKVAN
jgi:hypothetical protein